jgi:hypothetical protein
LGLRTLRFGDIFKYVSLLDDIITGSSDGSVQTADLLRKVQVVATRLGATDVVRWVKQELQGYDQDAELPAYRSSSTPVLGVFTGPMRSEIRHNLPMADGFEDDFIVDMRQPLIEIQAFAQADDDPVVRWSPARVQEYAQTGTFVFELHFLFSAENVISRQRLIGLIDTVRSKAMEFALDLQARFPEAGEPGGPTVQSNSEMAHTVYNITNNITGHGTNVAAGSDIRQSSRVRGDVDELKRRAAELGLDSAATEELAEALTSEGSVDGPRFASLIEKVRTGAIVLATSISSDVVAGSLVELGKAFLGLS